MSIFISAVFRGEELRLLNEIRMSLQAITTIDIATADGRSIRHSAVLLQQSNGLRTTYDWSGAVPLSPRLHSLWKRALSSCLLRCPDQPSSRKLCFHRCMGSWFSPSVESSWDWYWSSVSSSFIIALLLVGKLRSHTQEHVLMAGINSLSFPSFLPSLNLPSTCYLFLFTTLW